ncbi:MAG: YfiR family protein [Proteobacteria bacterium]|nr:YfiR family protein [Pseudomonadota bacterium]
MALLIGHLRTAAASLTILALAAAGQATRAAEGDSLEVAVKATYLYKLAPFVSWPQAVWPGPTAPLTICVQGADPFGPVLERAVSGQAVAGHPLAVRRLARIAADSGCQIAYLGGGPAQSIGQALTAVAGAPVLTVTDEARGGGRGIVNLVLDAGRVRFAIDAGLADRNGVAISSKLLALAVAVKR